jgi:hypothetical protein
VAVTLPFPSGGRSAQGAWDAFLRVTEATDTRAAGGPLQGATLLEALRRLVDASPAGAAPTIHVTGHSLGGAIASTVALHLRRQQWSRRVTFQVHTFAAPTAGDADVAHAFDGAFPGTSPSADSSWRVENAYDVVPNAWQSPRPAGLPARLQHLSPAPRRA